MYAENFACVFVCVWSENDPGQTLCAWVHVCVCVCVCQTRQSGRQTESSSESLQIDPMSTYHKGEDKEIISKSKVASAIWTGTSLSRMDRLVSTPTVSCFFLSISSLLANFLFLSCTLSLYLFLSLYYFCLYFFLPLFWIFSALILWRIGIRTMWYEGLRGDELKLTDAKTGRVSAISLGVYDRKSNNKIIVCVLHVLFHHWVSRMDVKCAWLWHLRQGFASRLRLNQCCFLLPFTHYDNLFL